MRKREVPVGSIESFAGEVVPDGWMVCDGTILNKVDYPKLFQAIGTAWGEPDVDTFNLPDLRGRFLRGVDKDAAGNPTPIARDPDRDTRTGNAGGNIGNNVGSVQGDAMQGHLHGLDSMLGRIHSGRSGGGSATVDSQRPNTLNPVSNGTHGTPRITSETRPLNANVTYIIKIF